MALQTEVSSSTTKISQACFAFGNSSLGFKKKECLLIFINGQF